MPKLIILCLLFLSAGLSFDLAPKHPFPIIGKWYYHETTKAGAIYLKNKQGHLPTAYRFRQMGKLTVTRCTDMCGCMAKDFQGRWKWMTKNTLQFEYKNGYDNEYKTTTRWKILSIQGDTLKTQQISSETLRD